jgi:hypothetical protein
VTEIERLSEGIRRADAAGDADAVRALGTRLRALQAEPAAPPPADSGTIRPDAPAQPAQPSLLAQAGRKLMLGTQSVGRGLAGLVGMPVDLASIPVNAALSAFGREPVQPVGGKESIARMFEYGAEQGIGAGQLPEPETAGERITGLMGELGTEALGGGGLLARLAQTGRINDATRVVGPIAEAYKTEPGMALTRDLAAGVGAGGAMGAEREVVPQDQWYSPIADMLAGLFGGVAGTATAAGPRATADAGKRAFDRFAHDPNISPDPETHLRPHRAASRSAAEVSQNRAVDPEAAAQRIDEAADFSRAEGLPMPTSGLVSDDEGLIALERRQRLSDPVPFHRRDREVRTAAGEQLRSVRPEGPVDPGLPGQEARRQVDVKRGAAEQQVAGAKTAVAGAERAEQDIGIAARSRGELADDASKRLDEAVVEKTMRPTQSEQRRLYEEIPDDLELDATPLVDAARKVREGAPQGLKGPSLDPFDEGAFVRTAEDGTEQIGSISSKSLKAYRYTLQDAIDSAHAKGDIDRERALKEIKRVATGMLDDLPESQTAVQFTREQIGPKFGQGEGGRLRDEINRDDLARSKTPPTKTAGRFLKPGAGGEEVATDLRRILGGSEAEGGGKAAARDYVLSDLAKVVGRDGVVDPRALRTWAANRQGMFKAFPEIKAEVDVMLRDVVAKRATKERLQQELEARVGDMHRTEREIRDSALSLILDKDPGKAVGSVFASGNPDKAMAEIAAKLGGNKQAAKGWKAAVADYLEHKVTNTTTGQTLDASDPVSWAKAHRFFKDHQKTLARVFDPEEMQALMRVNRLLEPYTRAGIQATPGSPTAENLNALLKPIEVVARWSVGHLRAGGIMRSVRLTLASIPGLSERAGAERLLHRMQLEPDLAAHLLRAPTNLKGRPAWNAKLRRYLVASEAAQVKGEEDAENE